MPEKPSIAKDVGHAYIVKCPNCQIILHLTRPVSAGDERGEYICHACTTHFLYSPWLDRGEE